MAQTHDIEDVLSSIRRLVANESGPAVKPHVPETRERPEGPTLVLSDSHRVTEPEDPFQMIRSLAQEERDGRDAEHLTDALPEDVTAITTDLSDASDAAPTWDEAAAHHDAAADDAPADCAEETGFSEGLDDETAAEEPVQDDTAEDEPTEADVATEVDVPADYTEDTDYDNEPLETTEDVIPFQHRAPNNDARQTEDGLSDLSASLTEDEALRDLISEIVRQELAGDLGERITRNVRKLVRREIRQMLASDEFD